MHGGRIHDHGDAVICRKDGLIVPCDEAHRPHKQKLTIDQLAVIRRD